MGNLKRVESLLELADEDLLSARKLLSESTRHARYHAHQAAEKAAKALLEYRGINPGREHRLGVLADMLPTDDVIVAKIRALDNLSPSATTLRYPTAEGRIIPPRPREQVEREIAEVEQFVRDIKALVDEPLPPRPK